MFAVLSWGCPTFSRANSARSEILQAQAPRGLGRDPVEIGVLCKEGCKRTVLQLADRGFKPSVYGPGRRNRAGPDETSRAGFRRKAREWLRAELAARHRLLEQEPKQTRPIVAIDLDRWLWSLDFAGVREPEGWPGCPSPNSRRGTSSGRTSRTCWHGP
jgi:hypothetical protein